MTKHETAVVLNAQSNARAWYANAMEATEKGETGTAKNCQGIAAYWNELALSHLTAEETRITLRGNLGGFQ
jgi:hypothetical protein